MKLNWIALTSLTFLAVNVGAEEDKVLKTEKDIASYAIGVMTARTFQKDGIDVDLELVQRGLRDGLSRGDLLLPEKELRQAMRQVQGEARKNMVMNRHAAAEANRLAGARFLAENKAKEGVIALPSGVQYSVIKRGDGKLAADSDIVDVNYRGNLLNGTEFDASEPGKPAHLKLSALIPGWKEALKLMPVGSKWQLVIPASAAYGERGVGADIGPNETLLFEVELVGLSR
jgi:FKBP-type peptidyl-prolyl cis-trans isomerase FklB